MNVFGQNFERTFLHELLHAKGYGEFAAYAGHLAAGYESNASMIKRITMPGNENQWDYNSKGQSIYALQWDAFKEMYEQLVNSAPKSFLENQFKKGNIIKNDNGIIEVLKFNEYINDMKEYGKGVIDGSTPVNKENDINASHPIE